MSVASPPRRQSLPFRIVVAVLLLAFVAVVVERRALRAWWWVRQLKQTSQPQELAYYSAGIISCGADAVPSLRTLAREPREDLRTAAMLMLGRIPGSRAAEILIGGLSDEAVGVRTAAAVSLGMQTDAAGLADVRRLATGDNPRTAEAAVFALERMADPSVSSDLRRIAADAKRPAAVRAQAIDSLGHRRDPAAVSDLLALLADRTAVPQRLIGDLHDEQFIHRFSAQQPLATAPAHGDDVRPTLRDLAAAALTRITGRDCGYNPTLPDAQIQPVVACWRSAATQPAAPLPPPVDETLRTAP